MGIREDNANKTQERKVKVLWMMLKGVAADIPKLCPQEKNVVARMISNSIFDMRTKWSGMESQALIDARSKNPKTTKCPEHYYPRQVAGARILQHIERYGGISKNKLDEFLDVFTRVHYTTSEENQLLKPYQKVDTFISPEHSYEAAGITLVKVK